MQLPYDIAEESEWNYSFVTKHAIVYHAYFIDYSIYHPAFCEVYTFNIEPETDTPHPIDTRIALTIVHILKLFFAVKERAMIMVCVLLSYLQGRGINLELAKRECSD